jgi:hypothetical protein
MARSTSRKESEMAKRSKTSRIKAREQTPEERAEVDRLREEAHHTEASMDASPIDPVLEPPDQVETSPQPVADVQEPATEATEEAGDKKVNSVVAVKFKEKYLANAREKGIAGKAAKRSNWDWLAENLAKLCLDDKHKISIDKFTDILDANGVDHSKWTNRNKGWEGRFRMTGRVALQKVVANNGMMKTPDGDLTPPAEFVARFKTKE